MSIHIGALIQKEVESRRLTYKEFGTLIHKNEKTIPDIYDRASMSTDLLLTISKALNRDFFAFFYNEEPLKSLCNYEVNKLAQKLTEENKLLQKELSMTQDLNNALREIISLAKEQIDELKSKLSTNNSS